MRKIKSLGRTLLALLLTATLLTGCGAGSGKAVSAIYVPLDDGDYVLIDRSTGAIFTIPSLDGIEDKSGNPVAASDLTAGNVLKIYGDGVMAASEPGYYAGVTRVVLDKQGKPEDIEAARKANFSLPENSIGACSWDVALCCDPVYLGQYPEDILKEFGQFFPKVTDADMKLISQPLDFFGQNIYNAVTVRAGEDGKAVRAARYDGFPQTAIGWPVTPEVLYWAPKFMQEQQGLTPAERGTAMHLVMQYLPFDTPARPDAVKEYVQSLVQRRLLTMEQGESINASQIAKFLASDLCRQMRGAVQVWRGFRFALLVPASIYDPRVQGEEMMLQGVADACFRTAEGLVVADFKTDRLQPGEEIERAERYRQQLEAYSLALSRVLEEPVCRRVLYFFSTGVQVDL